ncbi:MAG: protein kinase family protein [Oligoflexia bacterium]|nr:protein kinase family protein [Oligoflexia bacterium]
MQGKMPYFLNLVCRLCEGAEALAPSFTNYEKCLQDVNLVQECVSYQQQSLSEKEKKLALFIKSKKSTSGPSGHNRHKRMRDQEHYWGHWTKLIEYTIFPNTFPKSGEFALGNDEDGNQVSLLRMENGDFVFNSGQVIGLGTYKLVTMGKGGLLDDIEKEEQLAVLRLNLSNESEGTPGERAKKRARNNLYRQTIKEEKKLLDMINQRSGGENRGVVGTISQINPNVYLQKAYPDGNFNDWRRQQSGRKLSNNMIGDLLAGLKLIHLYGIVHLDLKSTNILIDGDHARITDFGNSKYLDKIANINPANTTSVNYIDPFFAKRCVFTPTPATQSLAPASAMPMPMPMPILFQSLFPPFATAQAAMLADVFALGLILWESEYPSLGQQLSTINTCFNAICSPKIIYRDPQQLCVGIPVGSAEDNYMTLERMYEHKMILGLGIDTISLQAARIVDATTDIEINKNLLIWLMANPEPEIRPTSSVASCIWDKIVAAAALPLPASAAAAGSSNIDSPDLSISGVSPKVKVNIVRGKIVCE